ncbi:STAS domain-containing protein [Blastococcus sp. VKM Ac-2987]|uniref:STAS domain-containing protein n=1 Tax=Blastococcus sp. VKM Ac-2987 TaxID=3004141 RepID=UPI0022AB972C|nr:STAS domain-containing protein [Blastococcus sp. VKM Ac-2987]MCZ2861128.1 STAS domain-containing protein [Blastococcus sp. VKM Ac-2987]
MTASSLDRSFPSATAGPDAAAPALVTLEVSGTPSLPRLTAAGEIDCTSAPQVRVVLDRLLDAAPREVVVDLTAVTFLDSAGLCALAATHRRALADGGRLRVLAATRAVIRPLQITGLWDLLGGERVDSAAS